jgi:hypothetical protein
VEEAFKIQLHPNNFNRDGGFMLSWTWQHLLQQVWNTSNEIWGQTQHSSDSVRYLLGCIQLRTVLQYGYISRTDWVQVVSQNTEDGDKVSLWTFMCLNCLVRLSAEKDFFFNSVTVKTSRNTKQAYK